ncbi:MAG: hypothetical protein GX442_24700, partial [Candidatus Riflebacteria bacterium]|nr:hypothetical protein [Candidatus Riflebacteria bacterium]
TPVSTHITLTALTDGAHTLDVIGRDALGNWQSTPTTFAWTIDTTAPGAVLSTTPPNPTNLTTTDITVGGTDVTAYKYSLDGGAYSAETPVTTHIALSALTDGAHTLDVIGRDALGNWQSTPTTFAWTIDTAAPAVVLSTTPANPTNLTTADITVAGTDVTAYKYSVDGGAYSAETPVSTHITLTTLTDGAHTLDVIGRDALGNWQSTPTTFAWTVDTTPPLVTAPTGVAQTLKAGGTSTSSVQSSEDGNIYMVLRLEPAGTQTEIDAAILANKAFLVTSGMAGVPNLVSLPMGPIDGLYDVVAVDGVGNVSTILPGWLTVDNTAPTADLADDHADVLVRDADTVIITTTFTEADLIDEATPPTISIGTALSNAPMAKSTNLIWTYSWDVPAGLDGNHAVTITATDRAGNPCPAPTGKTSYTIDNTGPTVTLSDDHGDAIVHDTDSVTITVKFTDADQIDETTPPTITIGTVVTDAPLTRSTNIDWIYVWDVPSSGDGVQNVTITATDRAGNPSAAPTGKTSYTIDNTGPIVSAPDATPQMLKSGDTSTSTVQSNEQGNIYLVLNLEPAATQAEIDAAILANKAFLGATVVFPDTPYTVTLPGGLVDGTYDIVGVDGEGNVSTIVPGWLIVDNTAPVATLSGTPADPTNYTTTDIAVYSDDPTVTEYRYSLDGGAYSTPALVSTNLQLFALSEGSHTLRVIVRDGAGNWQTDANATVFTWSVDSTWPTVSAKIPSGAVLATATPEIRVTFSEPMALGSVDAGTFAVDNGVTGTYSTSGNDVIMTVTSGPLPCNTTFQVTLSTGLRDVAGNSLATPYSWNFTTVPSGGITWTQAPAPGFSARHWFPSVVFDAGTGPRMWVIGGYDGGTFKNDIWSSADGATWAQETGAANYPTRIRHSAVVFDAGTGPRMWIIGGYGNGGVYLNDVWSSSDGITWVQETGAAAFPARMLHSSVVYDAGTGPRMWVIGGAAPGDVCLGDVWSSSDGVNWVQATSAAAFSARDVHTSVVFDAGTGPKMWVIGGWDGSYKNDVWSSSDGIVWTQETAAAAFPARSEHTSVVFDGDTGPRMWVIGGTDGSIKNDVWSSGDGVNWVQATPAPAFPARFQHSSVVFDPGTGPKMWVIGGYTTVPINDTWFSP